MSEQPQNEKEEKDEKGRDESWDEKWRNDPVNAAMWAILLIWGGLVLLGANVGWFVQFEPIEPVAIGFFGAGIIVLLAALFRLLVPAYRRPLAWTVILGVVFLGIGLGIAEIIDWIIIGPVILIGIGVAILLRGLFRSG